MIGALTIAISTVVKDLEAEKTKQELLQRLDDLRERCYPALAPQVMKAPEEISAPAAPSPTGKIRITSPPDKSQLPARAYIEGSVFSPHLKVWMIVHAKEVSSYWVQPAVTVREDGTWKVMVYLGRSGDIDVGREFEILAIANPRKELFEAEVLDGWPEAQWRSQVVTVIRK